MEAGGAPHGNPGAAVKLRAELEGRVHDIEVSESEGRYEVVIDGEKLPLDVVVLGSGVYSMLVGDRSFEARVRPDNGTLSDPAPGIWDLRVSLWDDEYSLQVIDPRRHRSAEAGARGGTGAQIVKAPMHGKVVRILAAAGTEVEAGQGLVVVEAMKMENELKATGPGVVAEVMAAEGDSVEKGEVLCRVDPPETES